MGIPDRRAPQVAADSRDAALLARCRQGDDRAWRELFDRYLPFVFNVARVLGTPAAEIEDVCQESFEIFHRKLGGFHEGRLTTWLYRITAVAAAERLRKRRVQHALGELWGRGETFVDPLSPDLHVDREEARRAVEVILGKMSRRRREVFALYEIEGASGEEIAERLGCKVSTVWTTLHFAREQFSRLARKLGLAQGREGA